MSDEERRLILKIMSETDCRYDPNNPLDRALGMRFGFKPGDPEQPADYMVCMVHEEGTPLRLPDNLTCDCVANCGRRVQHRPTAPVGIPKLCIFCASEMVRKN